MLEADKPIWSEVNSPSTSRISDEEMARINIEASAAMAEWIDFYRADPGGRAYEQLVNRAVFYLPMPKKTSTLKITEFGALAAPDLAARLVRASDAERVERARRAAEKCPSRVFANALVNTELMAFASERMALGMTVCRRFAVEQRARRWSEQVLAYGLAEMLLITPSRWTLTECSRGGAAAGNMPTLTKAFDSPLSAAL